MLYIKADEPRTLTFEVDINGVGQGELKGYVRFFINDAEHGFPVSIEEGFITADIPPLNDFVRFGKFSDGDIIEAKLELMTDQRIFTPWAGEVKVSIPMGIKAKLSSEVQKEIIKAKAPVATVVETKEDKAVEKSTKEEAVQEFDTSEEKMLKDNQANYKEDLMAMVADTIKQMGLVPAAQATEALLETGKAGTPDKVMKEVKKQKKLNEKDLMKQKLKNITKEGIFKYMERAGTKNTKIQELVYDQAVAAAGSGEPIKVLKKIVEIMKKRKQ
jgi:hypothetical protein